MSKDVTGGPSDEVSGQPSDQVPNTSDHELEKLALTYGYNVVTRGQWMGFSRAIIFVLIATVIIFGGYPTQGTVIASIDIVSLVAVFVTGKVDGRSQ